MQSEFTKMAYSGGENAGVHRNQSGCDGCFKLGYIRVCEELIYVSEIKCWSIR